MLESRHGRRAMINETRWLLHVAVHFHLLTSLSLSSLFAHSVHVHVCLSLSIQLCFNCIKLIHVKTFKALHQIIFYMGRKQCLQVRPLQNKSHGQLLAQRCLVGNTVQIAFAFSSTFLPSVLASLFHPIFLHAFSLPFAPFFSLRHSSLWSLSSLATPVS